MKPTKSEPRQLRVNRFFMKYTKDGNNFVNNVGPFYEYFGKSFHDEDLEASALEESVVDFSGCDSVAVIRNMDTEAYIYYPEDVEAQELNEVKYKKVTYKLPGDQSIEVCELIIPEGVKVELDDEDCDVMYIYTNGQKFTDADDGDYMYFEGPNLIHIAAEEIFTEIEENWDQGIKMEMTKSEKKAKKILRDYFFTGIWEDFNTYRLK